MTHLFEEAAHESNKVVGDGRVVGGQQFGVLHVTEACAHRVVHEEHVHLLRLQRGDERYGGVGLGREMQWGLMTDMCRCKSCNRYERRFGYV